VHDVHRRGAGHRVSDGESLIEAIRQDQRRGAACCAPTSEPVVVSAHHFQFLPTGATCIAALEALIRQAQSSLCLEMYIYKADATGERIRVALVDAAQRGVQLRILLDDFGSSELPHEYFVAAQKYGAQVRRFNPSRALRAAFRNHRKLCVADHRHAVIGGFNVANEYSGDGVTFGWRDLGLRIEGRVADELETTFTRLFIAARADTRAVIAFARGLGKQARVLDAPAVYTSGPGFQSAHLRKVLYRDFWKAHRVAIAAAYFTPPWRLRRALRNAAKRGIVRVLLPGKSDVAVMRYAAHHLYERLLKHRVEVFEYQPQILHSKLVVIDDVVYVGSCNFDVRSLQLNFDFLVRIPSGELAAKARQLFADDLARSVAITLPEWHAGSSVLRRTVRFISYWLATRFDPFLARRKWRSLR
jgi:cardiolipin synthase